MLDCRSSPCFPLFVFAIAGRIPPEIWDMDQARVLHLNNNTLAGMFALAVLTHLHAYVSPRAQARHRSACVSYEYSI